MSAASEMEQLAAAWLVRSEQDDWSAADQEALAGWLAADPAHRAAYWRLDHGWRKADRLRSRADGADAPRPFLADLRGWMALAACLALTIALAATFVILGPVARGEPVKISTAIGAQRDVSLADGSRLVVNTDSSVRASVNRDRRIVWLDRGEAYFEVAHDTRHPFVIHAGDRRITVLGTRFSVRRHGSMVRVSVIEGRVKVEGARANEGAATIVTAGDVAVARGASLLVVGRSPMVVEEALSWRTGMLTFDRTTLADAAAEFNRYNRRQLLIADERAADVRIGGSFQATNVEAFARLLRSAFGLQVRTTGDTITVES